MIWRTSNKSFDFADGRTLVMGVLNVTPDSFSDGGVNFETEMAVANGLRMIDEGADILDVGGESTRPGSEPVALNEELRRVLPVIEGLRAAAPDAVISIDTWKAEVARRALDAGAGIVNDISSFAMDDELVDVVAGRDCGYVLMHIQGTPKTMQEDPHYDDAVKEIGEFFAEKLMELEERGVARERVVVDPGIGFGKRLKDNLALLANVNALGRVAHRPVMVGPSRKSFIGRALGLEVDERLEATLAACAIAVWQGAAIVRVHDVREARHAVDMAAAIRPHHPMH